MHLTGAETSDSMRDLSATQHTYPACISSRDFSSGELPILRSQFAGDCAHVAVTRGQEQRPASGDSSIEGPRSGKDSRQSPFHSDASACRKSRRIKHETQCPELPYFRRSRNFRPQRRGAGGEPPNERQRHDCAGRWQYLADNAKIVSVAKASLSDIKPGSFIGTAATRGTDGKLQAIEVHIFPESMRGTGEGNRAWDLTPKSSMTNGTAAPKSSMTNGAVAQKFNKGESNKVNSVAGNDVTVNFNCGTKIATVRPDTKVVTLVPGDRSELKPNAKIFIPAATRTPDGSLEANRVTVGKDGIPPPM